MDRTIGMLAAIKYLNDRGLLTYREKKNYLQEVRCEYAEYKLWRHKRKWR